MSGTLRNGTPARLERIEHFESANYVQVLELVQSDGDGKWVCAILDTGSGQGKAARWVVSRDHDLHLLL